MIRYTWAVQRLVNNTWTHRQNLWEPPLGPRGIDDSDEGPYDFLRTLAARLQLEGQWRIVVWDTLNIDQEPVAVLEGDTPAVIPKAVDLPVGSVVATAYTAWIKATMGDSADHPDGRWHGTSDELGTYDWEPQEALDEGAQVLRVGDGTKETPHE